MTPEGVNYINRPALGIEGSEVDTSARSLSVMAVTETTVSPESARSFLPQRTAVSDLEIEMVMVSTFRIELRATSLTARFTRHILVDR